MFLVEYFSNIYLDFIKISEIISLIVIVLLSYRALYLFIGIFFTRKFKKAKKNHKYAILIAARNEEKVIGNLINSINQQDYPKELITTFVVADNCSDKTAKIVRENGAICYERFDDYKQTKGFALQYLFDKIELDYGIKSFEGYFVFDADNLLKKDYLKKMNDAFDEGEKIITSYRHSKNFDENWIASTYAIHWLRSIRTGHRARSVLHLATNIQGTGFLIANELVLSGWNYTGLTEDRALTVDAVSKGYEITYQDEAIFYDEQPISLKVALRQRLRWSRGHLLAFIEVGPKLFLNIFRGIKDNKNNSLNTKSNIKKSICNRFACFDILMLTFPFSIMNIFIWFISIIAYSSYSYINGFYSIESGFKAFIVCFLMSLILKVIDSLIKAFQSIFEAIYVFIIERKRIKKMSILKKVLYCFTWPVFDIIGRFTTYIALFKKVSWKPIPHTSNVKIEDLDIDND